MNFPRDRDEWGDLLTKFEIRNDTYPPSVVSRGNRLYIRVSAKRMKQSVVFMEVVASKCTWFSLSSYDFEAFYSKEKCLIVFYYYCWFCLANAFLLFSTIPLVSLQIKCST